MAGIILEISVTDNGTVKVKRFADETKKAFEEMKKGPEQAAGSLNTLGDSWAGVAAGAGIAAGAFYAFKRLVFDMAPAMASAGNEIERMARNLNMSTDDFQRWSYVAKMADVDVQGLGMTFQFLTRSMSEALQGSGDANKAFAALGINLKDTTGKTKDQQTVLLETIDALGKYAEGANRDALMMNVFGRSWMSVKPLIDQGTAAIKANMAEAERLSLILGKDVVKSLSESEDAFKKWSMTWKVARMEIFTPYVKTFTDLLEGILKIKQVWEAGGIKGIIQEIRDLETEHYTEQMMSQPPAWTREWVEGWTPPKIIKREAPALGPSTGAKGKEEDPLAAYDSLIKKANEWGEVVVARQELAERGWSKEKDIVEQVREEIAQFERETNEWGEVTVAQQEFVESGWKKIAAIEEIVQKAAGVRKDQAVQEIEKISEAQSAWTSLMENVNSAWNFNVTGILRDTGKIGDAFKNMATGMADAFISAVNKMVTEWLLFESVQGGGKKFLGGGSGIGSIVGWVGGLLGLQEGGIFTRPTPALIGEAGPEAVIPLKDGKIPIEGGDGGILVINHIQVTDPNTFVTIYGPAVKKLSEASIMEAKKIGTPWTRE